MSYGRLRFNNGPRWARLQRNWLLGFAAVNFLSFVVASLALGGDALNGKVEDGRHYLGNHGRYTEVSPSVWRYSRIHARSIMITHPIGLISGLIWVLAAETCPTPPPRKLVA